MVFGHFGRYSVIFGHNQLINRWTCEIFVVVFSPNCVIGSFFWSEYLLHEWASAAQNWPSFDPKRFGVSWELISCSHHV